MANRVLRDWTDSKIIDLLSAQAECLLLRMLLKMDNRGRMPSSLYAIRANCFPRKSLSIDLMQELVSDLLLSGAIRENSYKGQSYYMINRVGVFRQRLCRTEREKLIRQVFERDNYTCKYCGKRGGQLEADHIIPFSKGGSDDLSNLNTSCKKCNRVKGTMDLDEFLNGELCQTGL